MSFAISGRFSRRSALVGGVLVYLGAHAQEGPRAAAAVNVADYRLAGRSDREVLRLAIAAWEQRKTGTLLFERARVYNLGVVESGPDLFAISGLSDATLEGNGAVLLASSEPNTAWNCLSFSNVSGLGIRNLGFRDSGTIDAGSGMKALVFQPGTQGSRKIRLHAVTARNVLAMVQAQGPFADAPRVADVFFDAGCVAVDSYYALCCQNQGDRFSGEIRTVNCRRSYLAYGVSDHDFVLGIDHDLTDRHPPTRSAILIKAYELATRRLTIRARFDGELALRGMVPDDPGASVMIEVQGSGPEQAPVSDVRIEIDDSRSRIGNVRPAIVALSTVDAAGRAIARPQRVFQNITVAVANERDRLVVLPPNWPRAAGLRVQANADRLRYQSRTMDGRTQG